MCMCWGVGSTSRHREQRRQLERAGLESLKSTGCLGLVKVGGGVVEEET